MTLDIRDDRVGQIVSRGAQSAPRARYLPIAEHGLIGDLHSAALVGTDRTIDWYCCPTRLPLADNHRIPTAATATLGLGVYGEELSCRPLSRGRWRVSPTGCDVPFVLSRLRLRRVR